MRSYYAHLKALNKEMFSKPVFRSSAIFPVFHSSTVSTRVLFMGYWILKRKIQELTALVTLRNDSGTIVNRREWSIREAKSFKVECKEYLKEINHEGDFIGSIEIEFFSVKNLVFPFPAVVINYYGREFCSVVHTAQRVYNDFEDLKNNSLTKVPESGFNIHVDENYEPFISFINGPEALFKQIVKLKLINEDQEEQEHLVDIGFLAPYQTVILYPAQLFDLKKFLKRAVGAVKVFFHLNWVFPRLLVGNMQKNNRMMTITHTYYDCSEAESKTDYWFESNPDWYVAALTFPVLIMEDHFTNVYFYPIYSPSSFEIDVEIYNQKGSFLGVKNKAIIVELAHQKFDKIEIKRLCQELNIKEEKFLSIRLVAKVKEGFIFPTRVKIALDIGNKKAQNMPCNICTNMLVFNPILETKLLTFRWAPLLMDQSQAYLWILNSSPKIKNEKSVLITLRCYRESDEKLLEREIQIMPHGFFVMNAKEDLELLSFFQDTVGWCTITSSEPYISVYYFIENESGVVGGDHSF